MCANDVWWNKIKMNWISSCDVFVHPSINFHYSSLGHGDSTNHVNIQLHPVILPLLVNKISIYLYHLRQKKNLTSNLKRALHSFLTCNYGVRLEVLIPTQLLHRQLWTIAAPRLPWMWCLIYTLHLWNVHTFEMILHMFWKF